MIVRKGLFQALGILRRCFPEANLALTLSVYNF